MNYESTTNVSFNQTSLDYDKGVAYFAGETHAIFNPSGIQDYKMALDYFVAATTSEEDPASIAEAWNYIGVIYQNGLGVDEDKEKAFVAFESSAANGSWRGAEHLALKYYMGDGVEKDIAKAMEIFRLAWNGGYSSPEMVGLVETEAEKGNKDAQWCLGESLYGWYWGSIADGDTIGFMVLYKYWYTIPMIRKAVKLLRKASKQGQWRAITAYKELNLGARTFKGALPILFLVSAIVVFCTNAPDFLGAISLVLSFLFLYL